MPRLSKLRPAVWAAAAARWLARSPLDNRWLIGRLVELSGNRVTVDGLTFSLDNPLIKTRDKSTVCAGRHEAPERALVHAHLAPGLPAIELGAGIGIGGRGDGTRRVVVATTTLAQLLRETGFAQVSLVVDVEGAEADLVEQEGTSLGERVRTLIVETHPSVIGVDRTARMIATIHSFGFAEVARSQQVLAFESLAHRASL